MGNSTKVHLINSEHINYAASEMVQDKNPPIQKECYLNSFRAYFTAETVTKFSPVFYCEGWVALDFGSGLRLPISHGWLESDGNVIETTLPLTDEMAHYPVFRLTMGETLDALEKQDNNLPLLFMLGGSYVPGVGTRNPMLDAFFSAHVRAFGDDYQEFVTRYHPYKDVEIVDDRN